MKGWGIIGAAVIAMSCTQNTIPLADQIVGEWICSPPEGQNEDGSSTTVYAKDNYEEDGTYTSTGEVHIKFNDEGGDLRLIVKSSGTFSIEGESICVDGNELDVLAFNLDQNGYYSLDELANMADAGKSDILNNRTRCDLKMSSISKSNLSYEFDDGSIVECIKKEEE